MKLPHTLICILLAVAAAGPTAADPLDSWLSTNAAPIRSIDAVDEDFGDLEPLLSAIGSARVVQLGEPSHGAGSAFAAKVRIIKFLHQRAGFDVVAWESGLFDVRAAQQAGVLAVWSRAAEVQPLFEYARATQATSRPLEMAGIDMKASSPKSDERFAAELHAFAEALCDAGLRRTATARADEVFAAFKRISWRSDERPLSADLVKFEHAVDALTALLGAHRDDFLQVHAPLDRAHVEHALANFRAAGTNNYHRRCCETPAGEAALRLQSDEWNRRDPLMAANLRFLLDETYRGRKIIVWAHNAHLMRAHFAVDWTAVDAKPRRGGMTPMGAFLAGALGDAVYSIAFTTYEGEEAWANGQKRGSIAPAPAGSLEARLHALRKPYLFLDLRAARDVRAHPARMPTTLRISGYGKPTGPYGNDRVADVTRAFDAVFFVDQMAPATRIPD